MECPNCGIEIDKNTLVCPNCKKVLKIICPNCKTVNTKNICKKCGAILVSKCVKCGRINLCKNKKCTRCGYPTAFSALQNESLTDKFAVVKIEFPNSDVIKTKLGSNKLFSKFRSNFDYMVSKYVNSLGLRREIFKGDFYVIRFNRTYTFNSSAKDAMKSVIELSNMFARLNVKLLNRIGTILKCNITIMAQESDSDPYELNNGFRAIMLGRGTGVETKILDSIQVITDDDFYAIYNLDYKMEGLDSAPVNGVMKRFYEIDIKNFLQVGDYITEDQKTEDDDSDEIPDFIKNAINTQDESGKNNINESITEDDLYNIDLIDFDEVNCSFKSVENIVILDEIKDLLKNTSKGITAIKGKDIHQPYTIKLLSEVNDLGIYQNIISITCYDDMKYTPYSFFRELISTVFEYCVSQKLADKNDFSMFESTNSSEYVRDLINLHKREMGDIYEARSKYFQIFLDLFNAIPDTLIYIENFEKADDSSVFILQQLFEHFNDLGVSYLISYDKSYSLHKQIPFLLSAPYYTEISLIPSSFDKIVSEDYDFYKNVIDDFYFKKVAKYVKGSLLFLDFAIQYLLESCIYKIKDNALYLVNSKTAIIPSGVDKLIQRRLNLIRGKDTVKFLAMCVLLGTRIDLKTAESFGIKNWQEIADNLAERGFLYIYNNCIYFSNYNILKENLLAVITKKDLKEIAIELFNCVFTKDDASPVKAFLYEVTEAYESVIFEWEKLANINLSMGDYTSYINCSEKILESLDKYAQNWSEEDLKKYKNSLYENISVNMLDYNPEHNGEIARQTLISLKNTSDYAKFYQLCMKMIQGSVLHGEFISALNLTHKILSVMNNVSINPDLPNFDFNFLMISLMHVKILFNIGEYGECINIGYNILNVLDMRKINKLNIASEFKNNFLGLLVEVTACIALAGIITLKEDVREFLKIVNTLFDFIPPEFSVFIQLQNLIAGRKVDLPEKFKGNDVIAGIIFHITKAFTVYRDNAKNFAREIYKIKILSKSYYMITFELLADLLIGYGYIELNSYKKAYSIISQVENSAKERGLNSIVQISAYVMSILYIRQGKYDIAYGLLTNSDIQMEKTPISEYLVFLNKINMYIVLMCRNNKEQAGICLEQAKYISNKYNLNYDFNIDIEKITAQNQNVSS